MTPDPPPAAVKRSTLNARVERIFDHASGHAFAFSFAHQRQASAICSRPVHLDNDSARRRNAIASVLDRVGPRRSRPVRDLLQSRRRRARGELAVRAARRRHDRFQRTVRHFHDRPRARGGIGLYCRGHSDRADSPDAEAGTGVIVDAEDPFDSRGDRIASTSSTPPSSMRSRRPRRIFRMSR